MISKQYHTLIFVGTMYLGGTPLFDEGTAEYTYRYDYILKKFPDEPWMDDYTCDKNYPDCMADYPSRVGNNVCDKELNTSECGYDGGDCTSAVVSAEDKGQFCNLLKADQYFETMGMNEFGDDPGKRSLSLHCISRISSMEEEQLL